MGATGVNAASGARGPRAGGQSLHGPWDGGVGLWQTTAQAQYAHAITRAHKTVYAYTASCAQARVQLYTCNRMHTHEQLSGPGPPCRMGTPVVPEMWSAENACLRTFANRM